MPRQSRTVLVDSSVYSVLKLEFVGIEVPAAAEIGPLETSLNTLTAVAAAGISEY